MKTTGLESGPERYYLIVYQIIIAGHQVTMITVQYSDKINREYI